MFFYICYCLRLTLSLHTFSFLTNFLKTYILKTRNAFASELKLGRQLRLGAVSQVERSSRSGREDISPLTVTIIRVASMQTRQACRVYVCGLHQASSSNQVIPFLATLLTSIGRTPTKSTKLF